MHGYAIRAPQAAAGPTAAISSPTSIAACSPITRTAARAAEAHLGELLVLPELLRVKVAVLLVRRVLLHARLLLGLAVRAQLGGCKAGQVCVRGGRAGGGGMLWRGGAHFASTRRRCTRARVCPHTNTHTHTHTHTNTHGTCVPSRSRPHPGNPHPRGRTSMTSGSTVARSRSAVATQSSMRRFTGAAAGGTHRRMRSASAHAACLAMPGLYSWCSFSP